MRPLSLRTALKLYQWSWSIATPLLARNKRLKEGIEERTLQTHLPRADLWIQAASVGEVYLALELLKNINYFAPLTVFLTTNTKQGRDIIENARECEETNQNKLTLKTSYFPFDNPPLMEKALTALKPELVLLLESELWPGLLTACRKKGIEVLVVNGRMTEKSLERYLIIPSFWRLNRPNTILAMSEDDAGRFGKLFGQDIVETMPNMKFDRISAADPVPGSENPLSLFLPSSQYSAGIGQQFMVLGSVRQEEEEEIIKLISDLLTSKPSLLIGLFPRHMHRIQSWRKRLDKAGVAWTLRSRINRTVDSGQVLLWDTMGELYLAYSLAQAAFVGGSLAPCGGQNFLEPLTCGLKPVIGPHWSNFFWIGHQIITEGLVREAQDRNECAALLLDQLNRPLDRGKNRQRALDYIASKKGGTSQVIDRLTPLLFHSALCLP